MIVEELRAAIRAYVSKYDLIEDTRIEGDKYICVLKSTRKHFPKPTINAIPQIYSTSSYMSVDNYYNETHQDVSNERDVHDYLSHYFKNEMAIKYPPDQGISSIFEEGLRCKAYGIPNLISQCTSVYTDMMSPTEKLQTVDGRAATVMLRAFMMCVSDKVEDEIRKLSDVRELQNSKVGTTQEDKNSENADSEDEDSEEDDSENADSEEDDSENEDSDSRPIISEEWGAINRLVSLIEMRHCDSL